MGYLPVHASGIRRSQSLQPKYLSINSREDEGSSERTKTGECHRVKEEMKERLVGEGTGQHCVRLAGQRAVAERSSHDRS